VGVSSPTGEIFALGETGTDCSDLITGNSDSSAGGNDSGCDATCSSLSEGERATVLLDSVTSAICEDDVGISGRSDAKVLRLANMEAEHIRVFIGLYEFSKSKVYFGSLWNSLRSRLIYCVY
jgi:hypothetical protein